MIDRTTLLFALPGFRVLNVTLEPDGGRLVLVESLAQDGGCGANRQGSSRDSSSGWPRLTSAICGEYVRKLLGGQGILAGHRLAAVGL
jgi:hypothetical protein